MPSVRSNPARRPLRSVYAPRTKAPSGRIRNPAPKVINESISELNGFPLGKKRFADRRGVIAEHHEVVHLQKIATGDADH